MDLTYQTMRTFADSWGLVYMMVIFIAAIIWTFRPGSKSGSHDASAIPFKEDE